MKNIFYKFLFYCTILQVACTNNQQENQPEKKDFSGVRSIIQLDENLMKADSLVIVFYKDPHGADSLRYTRYYTQFAVTDSSFINLLKAQLTGKTAKLDKVKSCRSEGKIWCFSAGDIFQTIYFSDFNKECNFLYIIKDGLFYYSTLKPDFSNKLYAFKAFAKDPVFTGN